MGGGCRCLALCSLFCKGWLVEWSRRCRGVVGVFGCVRVVVELSSWKEVVGGDGGGI